MQTILNNFEMTEDQGTGHAESDVGCLELNEDPHSPAEVRVDPPRMDSVLTAPKAVLTLYESFVTACAAKAALRELEEISRLTNWTDNMWKFDMLRLPVFCSIAAAEAATA